MCSARKQSDRRSKLLYGVPLCLTFRYTERSLHESHRSVLHFRHSSGSERSAAFYLARYGSVCGVGRLRKDAATTLDEHHVLLLHQIFKFYRSFLALGGEDLFSQPLNETGEYDGDVEANKELLRAGLAHSGVSTGGDVG